MNLKNTSTWPWQQDEILQGLNYVDIQHHILAVKICADLHKQVSQFLVLSLPFRPDISPGSKVSIFPLTFPLTIILMQNAGLPNYGQSAFG